MLRIVGKIIGYHGVKGELKLYPLIDDVELFSEFESININDKDYQIESFRAHKNLLLVKLEKIDSKNLAETLTGYVKAELDEELADNEIYIEDLIGVEVRDEKNKKIGKVINFSDAAQKLISIKLDDNSREVLLPFVEEYIIDIAKDKSYISVRITDDLLELAT